MSSHSSQMLTSLGYFKDWSNYLLVTTVAALGWIATKPLVLTPTLLSLTILLLCLSIVFAIFTLALIPIVGESLTDDTNSFYDVKAGFKLFWMCGPVMSMKLKLVCWPQHIFFLAGIIIFSVGTVAGAKCG